MNNNPLLFFTTNDIPFISAKMNVHNPTIKEIGLIGEEGFRLATHIILRVPQEIKSQGKFDLSDKEDFDIFIELIKQKDVQSLEYRNHVFGLLALLFPTYKIRLRENAIQFMLVNGEDADIHLIDNTNFSEFQEIIKNIFSLSSIDGDNGYNPSDKRAEMIAAKLKKMKRKNTTNADSKVSVYKRYASILSIGMQMDVNIFLNYTVNQLEATFKRYTLWTKWDSYFKMKLAGATGLDSEGIEDWMQEV